MTKECELYRLENGKVRCFACAHKCLINEGKTGICKVRKNDKGKLYLLVYGKIASLGIDKIEKKPLYHFLPGTKTFSISSVGCNFKCDFCQNFDISQASKEGKLFGNQMTPEQVVLEALRTGCKSISYTYNEPIILAEFVKECAALGHKKALKNIMVTNGYWSEESFEYLKDLIDAVNIDLKSFNDEYYVRYCGGKLKPVLDTIKRCYEKGIHLEITTLIIPGLNDSSLELEKIAKFIASIDKNIPWHVTRFFPMYKMTGTPATPVASLNNAYKIGKKYLNNVHIGNV